MHIQFSKLLLILLSIFLLINPLGVLSDDWVYTVKEGDTLWGVTNQYLVDEDFVKKLQQLNNIADPLNLTPNTIIKIPLKWVRNFATPMHVRHVRGQVDLFEKDTATSLKLIPGVPIMAGNSIHTGNNSSAVFEFIDDSRIILEENSILNIEVLESIEPSGKSHFRLHLKKGRLETQVSPKKKPANRFEITTPFSVTSVRGTQYRVSSIPENTLSHTEVLEGGVRVSNGGKTELIPSGFGTITEIDKPPKPPIELIASPDIDHISKLFDSSPVRFTLAELSNGQKYRVQIATGQAFESILFSQVFSSRVIEIPGLANGTYSIRIRGIDKYGLEGTNAQFQFELNAFNLPLKYLYLLLLGLIPVLALWVLFRLR